MRRHVVLSSPGYSGWRWVVEPGRQSSLNAAARRVAGTVPPRLRLQLRSADYRRAVGGAFLAPWFAVSVGMLIAASLTLADPAATLSFPPANVGHCRLASCSARDLSRLNRLSQGSGSLAAFSDRGR
jgi:hypothetical protein